MKTPPPDSAAMMLVIQLPLKAFSYVVDILDPGLDQDLASFQ